MNILILEDDENRINKFRQEFIEIELDITKNPDEAIEMIKYKEYSYIFIDHDLEDIHYSSDVNCSESTGLKLGKFLGENMQYSSDAKIIIHSCNPNGSERIYQACKNRNPIKIPYFILWDRIK